MTFFAKSSTRLVELQKIMDWLICSCEYVRSRHVIGLRYRTLEKSVLRQ